MLLGGVLASLCMLSGSAWAQVITEFNAGITPGASPQGITAGPDGNVWFTERFGDRIGRITPAGVVTEFSTGITSGASPATIVAGADGALWFTEGGTNRIGRITTAGVVTEYNITPPAGAPYGIAAGPDGNLWFTATTVKSGNIVGAIGRISPTTHTITIFANGISDMYPYSIAAGPDGNLWFTEPTPAKIGQITLAGTVTEFQTSFLTGNSLAVITAGPDGNLWFAATQDVAIGRITTAGVITAFTAGISGAPLGIVNGPDGDLWFTEGVAIGRITPTGTVSEFSSGITPGYSPTFITAGPDGNLWFSEDAGDSIGRITTGASEPCGSKSYPFPYTDVSAVGAAFCPGIMEAYVTGISKGTSPTTFSPNNTVTRVQMTAFLQRSLDQGLTRASRRAAFNQWWSPQNANAMQTTSLGGQPQLCAADGEDIWTSSADQVVQVRAGTGKILGTWTGATQSQGLLAAAGKVFVAGSTDPGSLYVIDPTQPPGAITLAASNLGLFPLSIAFDGTNLWTANQGSSVSIITPAPTTPYPPGNVTTVSTGFSHPRGILYDGANIWVTDDAAGALFKLDSSGNILQTVGTGLFLNPQLPAFDGANIWVPDAGNNLIFVVQASTGNVVATITMPGVLNSPMVAAFDGERVLVTNYSGDTVTVFKAADLSLIANVSTGGGSAPYGSCSDGINFWIDLQFGQDLIRF